MYESNSQNIPQLSFNRLTLYLTKRTGQNIPNDLIIQYIWPFLSHPHQGRINKNIGDMNRCIEQLPRRTTNVSGPKIVYKLLHTNRDNQPPFPRASVKFIYSLHHSTKFPERYITIIEYVLLNNKAFEKYDTPRGTYEVYNGPLGRHFTEAIRQWYLIPATFIENNCDDPRFTLESCGDVRT